MRGRDRGNHRSDCEDEGSDDENDGEHEYDDGEDDSDGVIEKRFDDDRGGG